MAFFKHCIEKYLQELQFSVPMTCSTEYEKHNTTTVPLLCSISGQNLLCIQHVTEKMAGIFITTDTQLC